MRILLNKTALIKTSINTVNLSLRNLNRVAQVLFQRQLLYIITP